MRRGCSGGGRVIALKQERLKQIDVKHAHASLNEQSMMFDRLQDDEYGERAEVQDDDFSTSNFI